MMTAESVMLLKILSDIIITAADTIARVKDMSDEEVSIAIASANLRSKELMKAIKTH